MRPPELHPSHIYSMVPVDIFDEEARWDRAQGLTLLRLDPPSNPKPDPPLVNFARRAERDVIHAGWSFALKNNWIATC